jgi:5-methylcytosine-specific restriction endonuclease McrA
MKTYADKLKDPRWQKKRLEIMQRDGFKCAACKNNENTLHVHHIRYIARKSPWEAPNRDLITLCDTCHEAWHFIDNSKFGWDIIGLVSKLSDKLENEYFDRIKEDKEILQLFENDDKSPFSIDTVP